MNVMKLSVLAAMLFGMTAVHAAPGQLYGLDHESDYLEEFNFDGVPTSAERVNFSIAPSIEPAKKSVIDIEDHWDLLEADVDY